MSGNSSNGSLLPFSLPEDQRCKGHENFASWETYMLAHGAPRGLINYWENKIVIPSDPTATTTAAAVTTTTATAGDTTATTSLADVTTTTPTTTTLTTTPSTHTALHSLSPTFLEYQLHESVALSSILINLIDIPGTGVNPRGKSHKAWSLLKEQYGKPSERTRNMRERDLDECKYVEGTKVAGEGGHIEKMRTLRKLANDAGANYNDARFKTKLVDSFPESWDAICSICYNMTTLSEVIAMLTSHGERVSRTKNHSVSSVDTVKALEASVLALQAEVKTLRSNQKPASNPNKANIVCENTTNCGKTGHSIRDCFQLGGGKQGQYPSWWKGKRTVPAVAVPVNANLATTSSEVVKPGAHYALSATLKAVDISAILEENAPSIERVALAAGNVPVSMSSCSFADSGCTIHFFKSRDVFTSYKPLDKVVGQSSKEGTDFTILGTGNVELRVVFNGTEHTLTFRDALHAPDITANLLSIGKMDLAGWSAIFGKGCVRFFNKEEVEVFRGTLRNGLYLVHGSFSTRVPTALTARSLKSPTGLDTWHRRFAHFGASRVKDAAKLVDGLVIVEEKSAGQCEDCILANMKRRPFDDEVTPEVTPLRRTNIDIWGPSRVASIGGALYAMKFHDSGTSHRRTFFLSNRLATTTLNSLESYKLESEKVTGQKMVYVRTDNAPEFKGTVWTTFFNKNGLIHIPTAPYSSASNGTAERSIGISTATVRAMLKDSRLPTGWWAEAWAFADYVENLLPSVRHPGEIPEERWTGMRQDVGHIRVWGCVVYVYIPKEKGGGKLSDRAQKGRLIGIEGRGLYRVLIPETGVVIRSRNVSFEEGVGHRTLTPEGEYFLDNTDMLNDDGRLDFLNDGTSTPSVDPSIPHVEPNQHSPAVESALPSPRPTTNPEPRKSSRTPKPSKAAVASEEYQSRESTAANEGHGWATDASVPILENDDEEDTHSALAASELPPEPNNLFIPETFKEAFDPSRRHLWFPAMVREIQRWDDREVVTPVPRTDDVKTIKTKWVFDLKHDGDGMLKKRRARGVVKGFTQKLGEHYFESFAAVVRYDSVRMLFAIIASRGLDFWLVDFVGAFLNAKPQGENYLEIPEGFENHYKIPGIDTVLKMNLNLYGTMDGANNWFRELNQTFNKLGHHQSKADPCIRIHHSDLGYTITSTYTDDVAGGSSSHAAGLKVREELGKAYEITDLGRPDKCLGISIVVNDKTGDILLHQKPLIKKILDVFGMTEAKPKYTPLPPNVNLSDSQPTPI